MREIGGGGEIVRVMGRDEESWEMVSMMLGCDRDGEWVWVGRVFVWDRDGEWVWVS